MLYNVDLNKIVDWFIPPKRRFLQQRVWLRSLIAPAKYVQTLFDQFRNDTSYRLYITGQVVYLQKALNDNFDPDERRITVSNASRITTFDIYRRAEWSNLDDDEKVSIYRRSEYQGLMIYSRLEGSEEGGFVVNVPFSITNQEYYKIKSLVDYYKLASKQYTINS